MNQIEFNEEYRQRTKEMALAIIKLSAKLPYSEEVKVMRKQIIRSATSVAANFRAVCRARSDAEKYSKLCIVVEENDETLFWLELMEESKLIPNITFTPYKKATLDILKSNVKLSQKSRSRYRQSKKEKINFPSSGLVQNVSSQDYLIKQVPA